MAPTAEYGQGLRLLPPEEDRWAAMGFVITAGEEVVSGGASMQNVLQCNIIQAKQGGEKKIESMMCGCGVLFFFLRGIKASSHELRTVDFSHLPFVWVFRCQKLFLYRGVSQLHMTAQPHVLDGESDHLGAQIVHDPPHRFVALPL